nr:superoxide dismutase family protein [Pseudomonas graminis]
MKSALWLGLIGAFTVGAQAASLNVPMNMVSADGSPQPVGEVTISETAYGLVFTPELKSLPAGIHGFHAHENASCDPGMKDGKKVAALAAGGHFDPARTGKHLGPYRRAYPWALWRARWRRRGSLDKLTDKTGAPFRV